MGALAVMALAIALCVVVLLPARLVVGRIEATRRSVTAPAVVRRSWPTGVTVGRREKIGLALLVQPEGEEPFEVELTEAVAASELAALRPGHVVTVCYPASDPGRVALLGLARS